MRNKHGCKKDWYPKTPFKASEGTPKLSGNKVGMTCKASGGYAFSNVYSKPLMPLSSMSRATANKLFDGRKNK